MRKLALAVLAGATVVAPPAIAQNKGSSAHQAQQKGELAIPHCTRRLGTLAIVEPDNQWWREYNLSSPETIIKVFVQQSGCFGLVNRGRAMQSRAMERAMADQGELQGSSNLGKGQVKAADYFLQPDIATANRNSGGGSAGALLGSVGGLLGGLGRAVGAVAGGINVKKGEAKTTLSLVNARTTEEEALTEGYARKSDVSFGGGGGGYFGGGVFGAAGATGYQDTAIGQIIILSYLDAYTKLVGQLGGLSGNAAAAAPRATDSGYAGSAPVQSTSAGSGVSIASFNAMKIGMSYDQVVRIVGIEGNEANASALGRTMIWASGPDNIVASFDSREKLQGKTKSPALR